MIPSELGEPMRTPGTDGCVSPGLTSKFSSVSVKFRRVSTKSPARTAGATRSEPNIHVAIKIRRIQYPLYDYRIGFQPAGTTVRSSAVRDRNPPKLHAVLHSETMI